MAVAARVAAAVAARAKVLVKARAKALVKARAKALVEARAEAAVAARAAAAVRRWARAAFAAWTAPAVKVCARTGALPAPESTPPAHEPIDARAMCSAACASRSAFQPPHRSGRKDA